MKAELTTASVLRIVAAAWALTALALLALEYFTRTQL